MGNKKITLSDVVDALKLKVIYGEEILDRQVGGGYASDLLSDVMAHAQKNDIWITLQVHPNIVAVAVLKEVAGVITVNEREPDSNTVKKAAAEHMPLLTSPLPTYELAGKLYELGIHRTP